MDKKKVIARIEQLRIEKGISVYQLKENADISSTIYQWKKNATRDRNRTPSLRSIEKICRKIFGHFVELNLISFGFKLKVYFNFLLFQHPQI